MRRVLAYARGENRSVGFHIVVDRVGDELRHLAFIDAVGLGILGWNVEPPAMVDVDEGVGDGEGGKVFYPDGMQGQDAISNPLRTPVARASAVLPNMSASRIQNQAATTRHSVRTSRSAFDRGIVTSARSFSISVSHPKSVARAMSWAARRSL